MGVNDKCEVKGCRKYAALRFYGKWVCDFHWMEDGKTINLKELLGVTEDDNSDRQHEVQVPG